MKVSRQFAIAATALVISAVNIPAQVSTSGSPQLATPPVLPTDMVVPPSPEAGSLTRYVDFPPDYSSGTLSVSVPVFQWSVGSMQLGVGLSYTTGAVPADERAGATGIGWSLTCGGVINRSANGYPDEKKRCVIDPGVTENTPAAMREEMLLDYFRDVTDNRVDAMLDRYNYSIAGYSGSFFIDPETDRIIKVPQNDLRIERFGVAADGVTDFKITTPDGAQHFFTVRETSHNILRAPSLGSRNNDRDETYVSAWRLSKSISPELADTVVYTYGLPFAEGIKPDAQPYKYGAKELVTDANLNLYDFHARWQDPVVPGFSRLDQMLEKYHNISPYAYCAGNPIRFIDPTGMELDAASLDLWNSLVELIHKRYNSIISEIGAEMSASSQNQDKIQELQQYCSLLGNTLKTVGIIERSSQIYSLVQNESTINSLSLNPENNVITIGFSTDGQFVHELTHAGQFESGDIGFVINEKNNKANTLAQDVVDEVVAYQSQFAFDPNEHDIKFSDITSNWVLSLKDNTGKALYPLNTTGVIPVNMNSSLTTILQAYPGIIHLIGTIPPGFQSLKDIPNAYYKK